MAQILITETVQARGFRAWLSGYQGIIGAALNGPRNAVVIGGADGNTFTVALTGGPVFRSVLCALDDSARLIWSETATEDALTVARLVGLPVEDLDAFSCAATLRAVLAPGVKPDRAKLSVTRAVDTATSVTGLREGNAPADRRLAMSSVAQDKLWRPRQMAGWKLDMDKLPADTEAAWSTRSRLARENRIDLTGDNDEVLAWVASHGIVITDREGKPSLSRNDFERATLPDDAHDAWATFRTARSLKSVLDKLRELTRAETGGRVFSKVAVHHAVTGRGAVQHLHNVSPKLRPLLRADDGRVLASLDFSQAELRIAAVMSGDPVLAAALAGGRDPYVDLAVQFFGAGASEDPAARALLKRTTIACLYGQGANSSAADLGISVERATGIRDQLKSEWRVLFAWIKANSAEAKRGDQAFTITGRRLPALAAGREYVATNHKVQGSGADLLYRGVARVVKLLEALPGEGRRSLFLSIHDELVLSVLPENAERALEILVEGMTFDLGGVSLTGEAQMLGTSWRK